MAESINNEKLPSLIWFDPASTSGDDDKFFQEQLKRLNYNFQMIKDRHKFDEYVQSQASSARITLIVSGQLGEQLVPKIEFPTKITAVYVYCMNKEKHDAWAKNYQIVKGIFTNSTDLLKALQPIQSNKKRSIISEPPVEEPVEEVPTEDSAREAPIVDVPVPEAATAETTPVVEPTTTETTVDSVPENSKTQFEETFDLNSAYFISDTCFSYLAGIKTHPKEKDDMASFFKNALKENVAVLKCIDAFENNYSDNQAILWLQQEPLFSKFINLSFETGGVEAMYYCRILIRDLQKQLIQNKCTSAIQVYQVKYLLDEQFETLKSFIGNIIAMKSFFVTKSSREEALSCATDSNAAPGSKRVLFIIDANPEIENVKPFAKITLENDNDKNDVMFTIGSLFRITGIEDEKDGINTMRLTLCAHDETNQTRQLCNKLKSQHMNEQAETDRITFCSFLFEFGKSMNIQAISDMGETIICSCLNKLSDDDSASDRLNCYDALGYIQRQQKKFDDSLESYQKALDLRKEIAFENSWITVVGYRNLGIVAFEKGDFQHAREYFQEFINLWKKSYDDYCPELSFGYLKLAEICEKEDNWKEALVYYHHTLAIMAKNDYSKEETYAALYNNLGNTYMALKKYQLAMGYYNESLEIKLNVSSNVSRSVARAYRSIGYLYESMGNVQQAQAHLEKALEIYQQLTTSDDPELVEIENSIRSLSAPTPN